MRANERQAASESSRDVGVRWYGSTSGWAGGCVREMPIWLIRQTSGFLPELEEKNPDVNQQYELVPR